MMHIYQWIANSNAAPLFSDTSEGFIKAENALEALTKARAKYKHSCGLYSMVIRSCEEDPKVLARYLCPRAATSEKAGTGVHQWRDDVLYVNGKPVPMSEELTEVFE